MRKNKVLSIQTLLIFLVTIIPGQASRASNQPDQPERATQSVSQAAQPMQLGSTMRLESGTSPLTPLSNIVDSEMEVLPPDLGEEMMMHPLLPSTGTANDSGDNPPLPENGNGTDALQACYDYAKNGGFETGTDWSTNTGSNVQFNTTYHFAGSRSLYMTTQNKVTADVWQTVQLPSQIGSAYIWFKYASQLDSSEVAYFQILDASNNAVLWYGSIPSQSGNWYDWAYWLPQNAIAGKQVHLYFVMHPDNDTYQSQLWLDNVILGVCDTPPPTPTDDSRKINLTISLGRTPSVAERTAYQNIMYYAAEAIYEMSNGKHYLGTVTFYQNWANVASAHVIWHPGNEDIHPKATLSGYHHPGNGYVIHMGDYWSKGCGNNVLANLANQKCIGYTLAHELGHYYYGLGDEYDVPDDAYIDDPVEYSVMTSQHNALQGDYKWLNFSVNLTYYGNGWNTKNTQYRYYMASGWDTLVRSPSIDYLYNSFNIYKLSRFYFSELINVQPQVSQWPKWNLPDSKYDDWLGFSWIPATNSALEMEHIYNAQLSSFSAGSSAASSAESLEYPQPVLLEATIANKYLIARAGIQAQVESPGGEVNSISFKDDGIPPDEIADDGRYTGSMPYNANGSHTVTVNFDNASGEAVYTTKGLADGSQEFGDLVGTSLDASASTTITINGFSSDDHSDQFASATDLPSDNLAKWGQVDRPGDLDVFKGTLLGDGLHVLRLSNFAEGMKPRVKFWDAATGILIGDFTFTPVQGYYYIFYIKGPAGAGFYTEVSHSDGTASTGMYATSFGIPLEGEIFGSDVYLPIAIQR